MSYPDHTCHPNGIAWCLDHPRWIVTWIWYDQTGGPKAWLACPPDFQHVGAEFPTQSEAMDYARRKAGEGK